MSLVTLRIIAVGILVALVINDSQCSKRRRIAAGPKYKWRSSFHYSDKICNFINEKNPNNAVCTQDSDGSLILACKEGYEITGCHIRGKFIPKQFNLGNIKNNLFPICDDTDECTQGTDNCDMNANCENTIGSFNCTCDDGYTGDGVQCTACVSPCSTCSDVSSCQSCDEGYYLDGSSCPACVSPCSTCSDASSCQSCDEGYYLDGSSCTACVSPCSTCSDASSCRSCVEGYYLDGSSCPACVSPCSTCSDASSCQSCDEGYFILHTSLYGSYCTACPIGCSTCGPGGSCQSCEDGYQLVGSHCQVDCGSDFLCGTDECVDPGKLCDVHWDCIDGSDEKHCSSCDEGYLCDNGQCIDNDYLCDGVHDCDSDEYYYCPWSYTTDYR